PPIPKHHREPQPAHLIHHFQANLRFTHPPNCFPNSSNHRAMSHLIKPLRPEPPSQAPAPKVNRSHKLSNHHHSLTLGSFSRDPQTKYVIDG
ncbi:unnamed protein product, partial [Sphenostylis stenocarpa]